MKLLNASGSKLVILTGIVFAMALIPQALRANSITETFTVSINPAATLQLGNNFFPATVAQFDPADGTLTSVDESLTGSATWSSTASPQQGIDAFEVVEGIVGGTPETFLTPGTITLSLSDVYTDSVTLSDLTGTGTVTPALDIFDRNSPSADTFAASGLSGKIVYNYTPPATAAEPGSLALLSMVVAGFALVGLMRRKKLAGA